MEPFYQTSKVSTVAELGAGKGKTATIEGRLFEGDGWSDDALESAARELHGQSVVLAGEEGRMSVYDIAGSVDSATVVDGAVSWEASVRSEVAEALSKGADVVVRGRRQTTRDGSQRVVTGAEVGRLLVGPSTSEALQTAAHASSMNAAEAQASAALAARDGLDDNERAVLEAREKYSKR